MTEQLVKPIMGILTGRTELLAAVLDAMTGHCGAADITGAWQAFDHTHYYEDEMGPGLSRCFVSFEKLVPAEEARHFKRFSMEVESGFLSTQGRTVNIDPGYLDANKVVLVSGKGGGHKICLDTGVYADMLLWYNKGWQAFPWAFPDFRDGSLFALFTKMRTRYKAQLKGMREEGR